MEFFDGRSWIDHLFDKTLKGKLSSVSVIKQWNGKSCVINDPELTMANRYLGTHLEECLSRVDKALSAEPSVRFKPVVVTLRGVGCGQTRLLEEIRLAKNKRNDTLVLSITFNNLMDYCASEETFTSNMTLNFVLSVLLRYSAVAYQFDFGGVITLLHLKVVSLKVPSILGIEEVVRFARYFLQRLICDLESEMDVSDAESSSLSIIFMIDEIMVVYDDMVANEHPDAEVKVSFKKAISSIQKAFLNERFVCNMGRLNQINVALVISSLDTLATQVTDSKRAIVTLPYDEELSPAEIVGDWRTRDMKRLSEIDRFRLELVSRTVLTQPRIISFMSDFVRSRRVALELASNQAPAVTAEFLKQLYSTTFQSLASMYNVKARNVDYQVLYGLVFQKEVELGNQGMKMLRKSIITNSLFDAKDSEPSVVPNGSFLMLAYLSELTLDLESNKQVVSNEKSPKVDLMNPFHCFFMLLQSTLVTLLRAKEGDSLELIIEWWLKCRFASAAAKLVRNASSPTVVPLGEMFPFICSDFIPLPLVAVPISDHYFIRKNTTGQSLPIISRRSVTDSLIDIALNFNRATLAVDNLSSAYFESPEGQGFDHFISLSVVEPGKMVKVSYPVFITVINNKSVAVTLENKLNGISTVKMLDCSQFDRFLAIIKELTHLGQQQELSRISQALVEGRFRFVYLTTYQQVVPGGPNADMYMKHPNLVISDAVNSQRFFGMCWSMIQSFRSTSSG